MWNISSEQNVHNHIIFPKITNIRFNTTSGGIVKFQCARFFIQPPQHKTKNDDKKVEFIIAIVNVRLKKGDTLSYLVKYSAKTYKCLKSRSICEYPLTSMNISPCGRYAGIANTYGTIFLCETDGLHVLKKKTNCHE